MDGKIILLCLIAVLSGCRNGPDVHPCLISKAEDGVGYELICDTGPVKVPDALDYVCMSPDDVEEILSHLQRRGFGRIKIGKGVIGKGQ